LRLGGGRFGGKSGGGSYRLLLIVGSFHLGVDGDGLGGRREGGSRDELLLLGSLDGLDRSFRTLCLLQYRSTVKKKKGGEGRKGDELGLI